MPVRPPDFDHRHVHRPQAASEAGPIRPGALNTHPIERAERTQPFVQLAEPSRGRRERLDTDHPAVAVNHSGNVNVKVGVYPAGHPARLYDGHRHPFLLKWSRGGTHVPGRRP